MINLLILSINILIYGITPIVFSYFIHKFKTLAFFYSYFGFLFVFTQLSAIFYGIEISDTIFITGGNIAYSSLIFLTFIVVILTKDPIIVRNLILIQLTLNFFLFFLYNFVFFILSNNLVINILSLSPEIFRTTISVNLISFVLFLLEIFLMFYSIEIIKKKFRNYYVLFSSFVIIFIGIICLDGLLFPLILEFSEPNYGALIAGGLLGKSILGGFYGLYLVFFLVVFRESVMNYIISPFHIRNIIIPPNNILIEELAEVEKDLEESEQKYFKAYNRAKFYKDLFTHDITNIIQSISLAVSLMDKSLNNPGEHSLNDLKDTYEILKPQVKNALELINTIQKLSSFEDNQDNSFSLEKINLMDFLIKTVSQITNRYQKKNLNIKIESFQDKITVVANELLSNVFENIITNAIKYNDEEKIEILLKLSKTFKKNVNFLKIEFIDNGIGISDDLKKKIFKKGFKNLKESKGMGLGLSLVSKIVELYKGEIKVENKVKDDYTKGSNFVILIPLH